MKRARGSKLLALVMAAIMVFSLLPVSAFADDLLEEDSTENTTVNAAAEESGEEPAAPQEESLQSTAELFLPDNTGEPAAEPITACGDFVASVMELEAYANA